MALSNASFLPDAQDCAEMWREQRWPDGVECVQCGSNYVYLYLAQYQFRRNRRHLTALERLEEMIGFVYAYLVRLFFGSRPPSLFSLFS